MTDHDQQFQEACRTDPIVAACIAVRRHGDCSEVEALQRCIVGLVQQKNELLTKLTAAEGLLPRRIKMPDGKIARYDAPDDAIPITEIPA